jgi:formate hydrogenlyase transcriptional activator
VLLLRALQERAIERVGGGPSIPVDVRVIAATHRDLGVAVSKGDFRPDLFYRLNVFPIRVPPLRERREDIPDLVRHFVHHFGRRLGKSNVHVRPDTLRSLAAYAWPGNVRELENIVERAMIVTTGDELEVDPRWLECSVEQ